MSYIFYLFFLEIVCSSSTTVVSVQREFRAQNSTQQVVNHMKEKTKKEFNFELLQYDLLKKKEKEGKRERNAITFNCLLLLLSLSPSWKISRDPLVALLLLRFSDSLPYSCLQYARYHSKDTFAQCDAILTHIVSERVPSYVEILS